jgi:hypothetical protein
MDHTAPTGPDVVEEGSTPTPTMVLVSDEEDELSPHALDDGAMFMPPKLDDDDATRDHDTGLDVDADTVLGQQPVLGALDAFAEESLGADIPSDDIARSLPPSGTDTEDVAALTTSHWLDGDSVATVSIPVSIPVATEEPAGPSGPDVDAVDTSLCITPGSAPRDESTDNREPSSQEDTVIPSSSRDERDGRDGEESSALGEPTSDVEDANKASEESQGWSIGRIFGFGKKD